MKIEDLNEILNNRIKTRKKSSYTNKLLKLGPKKITMNEIHKELDKRK